MITEVSSRLLVATGRSGRFAPGVLVTHIRDKNSLGIVISIVEGDSCTVAWSSPPPERTVMEEVADKMAKELQESIDADIINDMIAQANARGAA